MTHKKVVAVSAGLWSPSKTTVLARTLLTNVAERLGGEPTLVELGPFAAELGGTLQRSAAPAAVDHALRAVEEADVLIAVTPVFRGAYSGHFKHFFDLVELDAFLGKPVVLAASGGGLKHCLVVEHHVRPLFAFFRAFSLPTAVYASDADFEAGRLTSTSVLSRVSDAAAEAARFFHRTDDSLPALATLPELASLEAARRVS